MFMLATYRRPGLGIEEALARQWNNVPPVPALAVESPADRDVAEHLYCRGSQRRACHFGGRTILGGLDHILHKADEEIAESIAPTIFIRIVVRRAVLGFLRVEDRTDRHVGGFREVLLGGSADNRPQELTFLDRAAQLVEALADRARAVVVLMRPGVAEIRERSRRRSHGLEERGHTDTIKSTGRGEAPLRADTLDRGLDVLDRRFHRFRLCTTDERLRVLDVRRQQWFGLRVLCHEAARQQGRPLVQPG
jgi:hypothetical protein